MFKQKKQKFPVILCTLSYQVTAQNTFSNDCGSLSLFKEKITIFFSAS